MYSVDDLDSVIEVNEPPPPSAGISTPYLMAGDTGPTLLGYYTNNEIAVVEFDLAFTTLFGIPNDEGLAKHPLYERGLRHYAAYEITNSSWIRRLRQMDKGHANDTSSVYDDLNHIIITFHDSTFECICHRVKTTMHQYVDTRPSVIGAVYSHLCKISTAT